MQIGLYGGSFNPFHLGHLNLAIEMLEKRHLDEVWLCPTAINPFKGDAVEVSAEHRLQMARLAIEGIPGLRLLDIELYRNGPSYTTDTLHQLLEIQAKEGKSDDFSLIFGDDVAHSFYQWRQPEKIIRQARLLVGQRDKLSHTEPYKGSAEIVAAIEQGLTPMRIMEISSTEIRDRLQKGLCCRHLLPEKVIAYIIANDLY